MKISSDGKTCHQSKVVCPVKVDVEPERFCLGDFVTGLFKPEDVIINVDGCGPV